MEKKRILEDDRVLQILRRIAYQIYENNLESKALFIVGVSKQGLKLVELIQSELKEIDSKLKVEVGDIHMDKSNPKDSLSFNFEAASLEGKPVILIDDVLNSGRTITHCLLALLNTAPSKIEIAVLVDRGHKRFPVSATYAGYELATTLEEHVEVKLGKKNAVYLY